MSKVQVDKVVNLSDDGAPQLTYGAELPVGYGLTGAGGLNISGVVTAASAVFSGNVTIGGTLTYEDVTNIDVVGVSTFAGRMNVNSSALFNEGLSVTAGVSTFAGTTTHNEDVTFTGANYNALWDKSKNALILNDNTQLNFGTDEDGDIYHDDGNMIVNNAKGKLMLRCSSINIAGTSNEKHIVSNTGVGVTLFYNNSAKFETTNDGTVTTGIATATGGVAIDATFSEASTDGNDLVIGSTSDTAKGISIVGSTSGGIGNIFFSDGASYKNQGNIQYRHADDSMRFNTNQNEAYRVDSDGRLLVGHTASEALYYTGSIQVQGNNSSTSAITIKTNQNDSGGPALVLAKSRGAVGGTTVVQSGDLLGSIYFNGADGTDSNSYGAEIRCQVDGTPGSNDMPGRLSFYTTADGAATATERVRIDSSGVVHLKSNTSAQNTTKELRFSPTTSTSRYGSIQAVNNSGNNHIDLRFFTSDADTPTERLRITSGGGVRIGTTSALKSTDLLTVYSNNGQGLAIGYGTGTNEQRRLYHHATGLYFESTTNQAYLSASGAWTDASDIAYKKDIENITYGIAIVKNLKPRKYKMKSDDEAQIGFIAQEMQEQIPEVVGGKEGSLGISYGKLTAVLTKALQEAITKIETLETKVAALESS